MTVGRCRNDVARLALGEHGGLLLLNLLLHRRGCAVNGHESGLVGKGCLFRLAADDLVVKLDVDVRIFVPACLSEAIFVELLQACELAVDKLVYELLTLLLAVGFGQCAEVNDVVADAWHNLYAAVGQNVDLHHEVLPHVVAHDGLAQGRDVTACEPTRYVARGDDEVAGVERVGHDAVFVVKIIVVAVLGLHSYHRQQLRYAHVHLAVFGLVTLGCLDKRTLLQLLLDLSRVDVAHQFAERVEAGALQTFRYLVGVDESVGALVCHHDLGFGAYPCRFIGFVEHGERT